MSPPSLRILMTTDAVGGVWTFAAGLASTLCGHGYEVHLVTTGPPPRAEQITPLLGIKGLTLEITDLALEWMDPQGAGYDRAEDVLERIEARIRPDVVHLNSFREAAFTFNAPVVVTAHSCVASWWKACRPQIPIDPSWHRYTTDVVAGLHAADTWVAPTAAFRDQIEALYQPTRPGTVIWNGTHIPYEPTEKHPIILAAGRLWDEAKNLDALDSVARGVDWPIQVAGPAYSPDRVTGISPRSVAFAGQLPHERLVGLMREAAIFVSPALYEPFGLTVLEAASCGCALVLSDIPTFRELWDDAALFVDPHDRSALRHALQSLCSDQELRSELRENARLRASRYSSDRTSRNYQSLYHTLRAAAHRLVPVVQEQSVELRA